MNAAALLMLWVACLTGSVTVSIYLFKRGHVLAGVLLSLLASVLAVEVIAQLIAGWKAAA